MTEQMLMIANQIKEDHGNTNIHIGQSSIVINTHNDDGRFSLVQITSNEKTNYTLFHNGSEEAYSYHEKVSTTNLGTLVDHLKNERLIK